MISDEVVLKLAAVSKTYRLFNKKTERMKEALHPFKKKYHKEFFALKNIDLEVRKGEILGIVGMNGSGKSTLLKIIAGIITPTTGSVEVKGNIVPLLELGAGFNPDFTGLENIFFYNSILGKSRADTLKILDRILDFAEIGDFIHQPIKTYSSGMKARLAFAVSVNIDPDILIIDEVLAVGDELFRRKSFSKIEEFFKSNKTVFFVSHSAQHINQLCTRAIMLHHGDILLDGTPKFVTMNYSKFIYSHSSVQKLMVQEFRNMRPEEIIVEESERKNSSVDFKIYEEKKIAQNKPYLLPGYKSKSTIITKNARINIDDFHIETLLGETVNVLVPDENYQIIYHVSFLEDLDHVNFTIGFKTETGFPLCWKVYPANNAYIDQNMKSGDSVIVTWTFKCLFCPGTYFVDTAMRGVKGNENVILFRGSDFFAFKVLDDRLNNRGGVFDTGLSFSLQSKI